MTLLELLVRWSAGLAGLRQVLVDAKTTAPDLAPQIDAQLALLDQVVSAENFANVVLELPGELQDIIRGRLNPANRPSDLI